VDPIADMLTIIRNGYMAKKPAVSIPFSKFKLEVVKILEKEGYVGKVNKNNNKIDVDLVYEKQKPKVNQIKKVSKLGLRIYSKRKHLKSVKGGRGIYILTTAKGVMTEKEAKKKNLGGEVICQVW